MLAVAHTSFSLAVVWCTSFRWVCWLHPSFASVCAEVCCWLAAGWLGRVQPLASFRYVLVVYIVLCIVIASYRFSYRFSYLLV